MKPVVIGVGGAGCNIVARMTGKRFVGVKKIVADTDMKRLLHCRVLDRILLGEDVLAARGAEGAPETGSWAARASKIPILKAVGKAKTVVLVAGLGGGTGSGATPTLAEMLDDGVREIGAVAVLPFAFEGPVRWKRSMDALRQIQGVARIVEKAPNVDPERKRRNVRFISFSSAMNVIDGAVIEKTMKVLDQLKGC
jgi:cell division protein FtsZ